MKDFNIRQLFYPYKVWKKYTTKEIIPIMLIKHDNIFNFYIYTFENDNNYNSIKLRTIKRFILGEVYTPIEFSDIRDIMETIDLKNENTNIPFPQANSFYRLLDLINELSQHELSAIEVANIYEFDVRQANYYLAAGEYLGLITKEKNYKLSDRGKMIVQMDHKKKNLEIVKIILSHKPFYFALEQYLFTFDFDCNKIVDVIYDNRREINSIETAKRRSSTVISWVKWILELTTTIQ